MELREFIKETLIQIVQGVSDAQKVSEGGSAAFAPDTNGAWANVNDVSRAVHSVSFEVVLGMEEKEGKKSGIGVVLTSISAGTSKNAEIMNRSVTTISFAVPIVYPKST